MLLVKFWLETNPNSLWSRGLKVHKDMRKIIPISSKNKTAISAIILLAVEEILNDLMRLDNVEDTRLSVTLSLYNKSL